MITIIGAGELGSQIASKIQRYKLGDITLIDMDANQAKNEALNNVQVALDLKSDGKITFSNNYQDMQKSNLVIMFSGKDNKSSMVRSNFINTNAQIIKNGAQQVAKYAPNSILIIAADPVDIMTYIAYKATSFPRNRILGIGSIFDSLYFESCIATELDISKKEVNAMVIGEHGDTMMPLVEYANVSGIPLPSLLTQEQMEKIVSQTVTHKTNKWSAVHSSTIAIIANAMIKGKSLLASVSTPLKGEYGYSDIAIGVPAILGKNGIQKILELRLSDKDKKRFENSVQVVKTALYSVRFDG